MTDIVLRAGAGVSEWMVIWLQRKGVWERKVRLQQAVYGSYGTVCGVDVDADVDVERRHECAKGGVVNVMVVFVWLWCS